MNAEITAKKRGLPFYSEEEEIFRNFMPGYSLELP